MKSLQCVVMLCSLILFPMTECLSDFMTIEEIKGTFETYEIKRVESDALRNEIKEREAELIPEDVLFDEELMREIDKKRSEERHEDIRYTGTGSDLRLNDTTVKSQWDGTCTAFGLIAAIENKIAKPKKTDLSERHFWDKYKYPNVKNAINTAMKHECITMEKMWPQENTSPYNDYLKSEFCHTSLIEAEYIQNDIQKAITVLDKGYSVYVGMNCTKSMSNRDKVLDPYSPVVVTFTGKKSGHAIAIVGYKIDSGIPGGGYFIIKNSWGYKCGDRGYQYAPFQYWKRNDMYCLMWAIKSVKSNF